MIMCTDTPPKTLPFDQLDSCFAHHTDKEASFSYFSDAPFKKHVAMVSHATTQDVGNHSLLRRLLPVRQHVSRISCSSYLSNFPSSFGYLHPRLPQHRHPSPPPPSQCVGMWLNKSLTANPWHARANTPNNNTAPLARFIVFSGILSVCCSHTLWSSIKAAKRNQRGVRQQSRSGGF